MRKQIKSLSIFAALLGCSSETDTTSANSSGINAESADAADAMSNSGAINAREQKPPEKQADMFRWSSGMQMGTFWAAILNEPGDAFRLFSEYDQDGNVADWSPTIEVSDSARLAQISEGEVLNLVVGGKAWVFPYQIEDGTIEPVPMSGSGHSDMLEFLSELQTTTSPSLCVEFPESGHRTCFSTSGMREAIALSG